MRSLISHLRYAVRLLAKSPGFTITSVLILALGIGANTAIFSLVNSLILRPLPYPKANQLVHIFQPFQNHENSLLSYPDFAQYGAAQHTFESLTAFTNDDFNLTSQREPERVSGYWVSGTFFKVLGRPFLAGRPFGEAEDKPEAAGVVVLSEHLWRTRFNSDPKVIGTSILLNATSFQVIGVTPRQADEGGRVDLYVPLGQNPDTSLRSRQGAHYFSCVGRLKDGVTLQQARTDLNLISQHLDSKYPATAGFGIRLVPYLESVTGEYRTMAWVMEGAVTCLLLIACANVANLLLARAKERRREITVRAALGASRGHLVTQLLTESLVLAVTAGMLGLLISFWSTAAIKQLVPSDVPRFEEFALDGNSLLFVIGATILSALISGLLPAWSISRADVASALKEEGDRSGTAGQRRYRGQARLVVLQVALACLLLTGAGLLARSFLAIEMAPLGFKTDHILTADLYLADAKYSTLSAAKVFLNSLLERLNHLPGVVSAGFSDDLPFKGPKALSFGIDGQADPEPSKMPVWQPQIVSADFFRALGIPLLRGRSFDEPSGSNHQAQVIISERLAKSVFPGQDPIGKQLHDYNSSGRKPNSYTIVGIVPNIRHDSPGLEQTPYQAYFLYSQDPYAPWGVSFCTLVLRTEGDPLSLAIALKQSVAAIDPNLPLSSVETFDEIVQQTLAERKLGMVVVSSFSTAALLLAAVGLYGALSYTINQRRREIGVRIALGAQPSKVLGWVMRQGLIIVANGLILGLGTALLLTHLMASMLYEVSATDPLSLGVSVLVLGLAAGLACLLPAWRATRINPITALRE